MHKASFIKTLSNWRSDARLYKLEVPVDYIDMEDNNKTTAYVIVSAVHAPFSGPETYIFPSDENGTPYNLIDLEGSFQGAIDHEKALRLAGYEIC